MSTSLEDMKGGVSNCCGAVMYEDLEICSDCKEHCESVEDEEEDNSPPKSDEEIEFNRKAILGIDPLKKNEQ